MLKIVPRAYFYSLVKIRSVTAEILLIWTNVARTNVALTNVTMTIGIRSRWSHEPSFKVWTVPNFSFLAYLVVAKIVRLDRLARLVRLVALC